MSLVICTMSGILFMFLLWCRNMDVSILSSRTCPSPAPPKSQRLNMIQCTQHRAAQVTHSGVWLRRPSIQGSIIDVKLLPMSSQPSSDQIRPMTVVQAVETRHAPFVGGVKSPVIIVQAVHIINASSWTTVDSFNRLDRAACASFFCVSRRTRSQQEVTSHDSNGSGDIETLNSDFGLLARS